MTSVLFENSTVVTLDDSNSVFDTGWVFAFGEFRLVGISKKR